MLYYAFEILGIGTFARIVFRLLSTQNVVYLFFDVGKTLNRFLYDTLYIRAKFTLLRFRIVQKIIQVSVQTRVAKSVDCQIFARWSDRREFGQSVVFVKFFRRFVFR